jgi:hypothetical protein
MPLPLMSYELREDSRYAEAYVSSLHCRNDEASEEPPKVIVNNVSHHSAFRLHALTFITREMYLRRSATSRQDMAGLVSVGAV